ncbi:MAG TPA: VOC family protein [Solirubrobacteraceae bacterium]|jgi:catechol 2,3-dioxygenase-like lactoylglutathione lyase family enzyme|nr:VOC family protein [Solirubrobacteraceae bacterium]
MADTASRTNITDVGTVIVPVSDQDRAIEFYTEKLGLEKRSDTPFGRGERWVEVAPVGAATTLALIPPREGGEVGVDTRIAFSTSDAEADHARLRERGVDVDEQVMRMGDPVPPMFFFRDGDGNTLLIVESSS